MEDILNEEKILTKLLYRNKNQHSRTLIYKGLKRIQHFIRKLPETSVLIEVVHRAQEIVKQSSNVSSNDVILLTDVTTLVSVFGRCANWCYLVSERLRNKLSKMEFVPLYTVQLCLVSHVCTCVVSLLQTLYYFQKVIHGKMLSLLDNGSEDDDLNKIFTTRCNIPIDVVECLSVFGIVEQEPNNSSGLQHTCDKSESNKQFKEISDNIRISSNISNRNESRGRSSSYEDMGEELTIM